jgi:hypothetical protein
MARGSATDDILTMGAEPPLVEINEKNAEILCRAHKLLYPVGVKRFYVPAVAVLTFGCAKTYIPNTDVQDTGENRNIILFCEKYRHAMEDRNVADLLKLMSPAYFEDGGNTKNEDDADFEAIRQFLTGDFLKTSGIRYEIRYRRVTLTETNHIFIDYSYAAAWKIPGPKTEEWHHEVTDNRLDLVRDGESFKIVSGM